MVPWHTEPAGGPCGINFIPPFQPTIDDIREAAGRCRVAEFFYDEPDAARVDAVHAAGALAAWQVGSAAEAAAADEAGCDFVIAQGVEAGGHVRAKQPLDEVLRETLEAVKLPVLAAGGIATAERVAEVIAAGADGVRVGTRFVTCPESGAHPEYVAALLGADGSDTELTEWFEQGWEHAPHRVLRAAREAAEQSGFRIPIPTAKGLDRPAADTAMYAGTGVGEVSERQPAADVVADLVRLL
jgi:NAD(P)H-dependent flavin oxidoreductase YrpB (nitropropane dioxygenase family)